MEEIKDTELIRDELGSPVPQYWDETSGMYIARTVDGSFADVDFSKVRLLRDRRGSVIPQLWDVETARFVPGKGGGNGEVTIESVPGLKEKLDTTTATLADTVTEVKTNIFSRKINPTAIKKAVVFIDDDGRKEVLTILKPIADEKGFKFTSAILPKFINEGRTEYMNWNEVKTLIAEGHDVASHSVTHVPLNGITIEAAETELKDSKELLRQQGIEAEHFVYPGGGYNRDVANVARKYYKSAISTDYGFNEPPNDQYVMKRIHGDTSTLTYLKARVDMFNAMESGILIIMTHVFFPEWTATKQQELRDFVDYVKLKSLPIMTYSEAFENLGNVIDIGNQGSSYFKVSNSGKVYSDKLDVMASEQYPRNTLFFTTPPSFFKSNHVAITSFNGAHTESTFPENKNGTLVTYKGWDVATQYWYPYQSDSVYVRRKHNTNDSWSAFIKQPIAPLSKVQILDFGVVDPNSTKEIGITFGGVIGGSDMALVNPKGNIVPGINWSAHIKQNDVVTVRLSNVTTAPITISSTQEFMIKVFRQ